MRLACIVAPLSPKGHVVLIGSYSTTDRVRTWFDDGVANGEMYPGAKVVRLPRRLTRGRAFELVLQDARWWDAPGEYRQLYPGRRSS